MDRLVISIGLGQQVTAKQPKEIGFWDTPGWARGVAVLGSYAYVADGVSGLRIIDALSARPVPPKSTKPKPSEVVPITERPKLPPRLETSLSFEELGRKNSTLDAGEEAFIVVTVANNGKGEARNLKVRVEPISSMSGLEIGQEAAIPTLAPDSSSTVRIRLRAKDDVPDQQLRLRVSVTEPVFGMDAVPNVITVASRKLEPPDLAITDQAIDDGTSEWAMGNGNRQWELGEQVEITNVLQNRGSGDALGVSVEVRTLDENVLFQGERNPLTPGDISAGDCRLLKYPILVNTRYKQDKVKLVLAINEQRPKFSRIDTLTIPPEH